eukprot:127078_1
MHLQCVVFEFILFLMIIHCKSDDYGSSGCNNAEWVPGSTISYNYTFNDYEREYIVHVPINYNMSKSLPIIYALPGSNIWPGYFSDRFGMQMQADTYNYLSVITTGEIYESPDIEGYYIRRWNDLSCSGSPKIINDTYSIDTCNKTLTIKSGSGIGQVPLDCADDGITINNTFYYNVCNWCSCHNDDIGYLRELTTFIESQYCVDKSREYVIGYSNGGMMTQRIACEANDIFAAAAAFAGQMSPGFDCKPKYNQYTMPFMNIWEYRDQSVPGLSGMSASGLYFLTVDQVQKQFAEFNGCDVNVEMEDIESISDGIQGWQCKSYNKNCRNNAFTMVCGWNGTHDYPTNGTKYSQYYGRNMSSAPPGYNFGLNAAWQYLAQFQRIPIEDDKKDDGFGVLYWSLIGIGGLIVIVIIVLISCYCIKKRHGYKATHTSTLMMSKADKIDYNAAK